MPVWTVATALAVAVSQAAMAVAQTGGEYVEDEVCVPSCRAGFACVDGQCLSPCNPQCAHGEVCTRSGKCIPAAPPAPPPAPVPAVTSRTGRPAPYPASSHVPAKADADKRDDYPNFALVINPAASILGAIFDMFIGTINMQIGGRYAGIDVVGSFFVGDNISGGQGEGGLRIMPMGRGLHGFYLVVPRLGGGSFGFTVMGELGWEWFIRHFVITLGGGGGWGSEIGGLPYGNLSIGFGG